MGSIFASFTSISGSSDRDSHEVDVFVTLDPFALTFETPELVNDGTESKSTEALNNPVNGDASLRCKGFLKLVSVLLSSAVLHSEVLFMGGKSPGSAYADIPRVFNPNSCEL